MQAPLPDRIIFVTNRCRDRPLGSGQKASEASHVVSYRNRASAFMPARKKERSRQYNQLVSLRRSFAKLRSGVWRTEIDSGATIRTIAVRHNGVGFHFP
jgi:hypothetical protein